jgi:hypothetical protein
MVFEKVKKSESSIWGIVSSILIVIFIFSAGFYWISDNATESGRPIDAMYNTSFTQLQAQQNNLSSTMNDLRNNAEDLTEPDNSFSIAWNGLKGLVNVVRGMFQMVNLGSQTSDTMMTTVSSLIPTWLVGLITLGIIAFIILVIIAIFKGDSGKVIN